MPEVRLTKKGRKQLNEIIDSDNNNSLKKEILSEQEEMLKRVKEGKSFDPNNLKYIHNLVICGAYYARKGDWNTIDSVIAPNISQRYESGALNEDRTLDSLYFLLAAMVRKGDERLSDYSSTMAVQVFASKPYNPNSVRQFELFSALTTAANHSKHLWARFFASMALVQAEMNRYKEVHPGPIGIDYHKHVKNIVDGVNEDPDLFDTAKPYLEYCQNEIRRQVALLPK